ncbi:MAG: hypothetical protein CBD76_00625 [Pelagibacteraceae bacterium TMED216]|nr:MAG: hypothetical protein CBD76_00625 [Pelagibacteraceae bacterium TMED216]|tara:strand:+ start:764 stop:2056 length:1293 start_codon:yes stop_codon:yes gene_type:complete
MKKVILLLILLFPFKNVYAENNLIFFLESAFEKNPKLNAERKNLESIKQNINISRSEYLPSLTITGSQSSIESFNRTDNAGSKLNDINLNSETKSISIDQKIFQGFKGYNNLKKSQIEVERASFELKKVEQEILFNSLSAFYDLVFKLKSKDFNLANVDLFERQVESDKARLQKGEITLSDLAQSESSLAGANAQLITAETDLINSKTIFKKITRVTPPEDLTIIENISLKLPKSLPEALITSKRNNPILLVAKMDTLIAEKDFNIEKAKLAPSASINYTKSENQEFSSAIDEVDEESLKATLKWPIIQGGKNYSSIKQSKLIKQKKQLLFNEVQNQVNSNTTNAWSNYQSSKSVLSATQSQLKAAEIANEGITLEYDSSNTRTTLELIQSRSLLLNARISNAKAERDFMISQFNLLDQIGKLDLNSLKR